MPTEGHIKKNQKSNEYFFLKNNFSFFSDINSFMQSTLAMPEIWLFKLFLLGYQYAYMLNLP